MVHTIPVEAEDGGYLEVYRLGDKENRLVLTVKGPRGGNRYILWLTRQEADSLRDALAQVLAKEVQDA